MIHYMQMKVTVIVIPVIIMFCIIASISAFVFHDHHHRKVFVGSLGVVASVIMYASPLVAVVSYLFSNSQLVSTKETNLRIICLFSHSFQSKSCLIILVTLNNVQLQKQVIVTKSVEFMPFYLSFFSFLNSSLWMAYGLLSHDLFIAVCITLI